MPTYQYRCRTCDTMFEEKRSFAEADEVAQCECGSDDTRKVISAIPFSMNTSTAPSAQPRKRIPMPMQGGCCGGICGGHH